MPRLLVLSPGRGVMEPGCRDAGQHAPGPLQDFPAPAQFTGYYPLCPKVARGDWTPGLTGASLFSKQKTEFGVEGWTCLGAFGRSGGS